MESHVWGRNGERTIIRGWSAWKHVGRYSQHVRVVSWESWECTPVDMDICFIMLLGGLFLFSSLNFQLHLSPIIKKLKKKKKQTCGSEPVVYGLSSLYYWWSLRFKIFFLKKAYGFEPVVHELCSYYSTVKVCTM